MVVACVEDRKGNAEDRDFFGGAYLSINDGTVIDQLDEACIFMPDYSCVNERGILMYRLAVHWEVHQVLMRTYGDFAMERAIYLKNIAKPKDVVVLDTMLGKFFPGLNSAQIVRGNYFAVRDQEMSVFLSDSILYFQWNDKRWSFTDLAPVVRYGHNFQEKLTEFAIGDVAIEYPAWWASDPTFDPNMPERDEDEDLFAYVASLAHNGALQRTLIKSWDK